MNACPVDCPIPCNLCGSVDVEELGLRDRSNRLLRTTICRQCGLVWSNPRPAPAEVRRYYTNEYRLEYKGRATPGLRQTARSGRGALNRYRALAPVLKPADRVLDAGSGSGEVVYVLKRLGFDASGLEPDEQYARFAREALGVPVRTGFVQDVSFPPGSFDVVTMYHALEHVEDPVAILSKLRTWMTDDARLLIEVPNIEARCIAPSHRFHFAHFYNFNHSTLEAVGRKAGFEPLETRASPDGGNLLTAFRRAATGASPPIDGSNYRRVARIMRNHTQLKYYCSAAPYAGPAGRLRVFLQDWRAMQGCKTPREVLDKLIATSGATA